MPTYDPNKTYIASVFDGIILKLRLSIEEFPDIAVNVGISQGDPNGVVTGSPGDIRIDLDTPTVWQKITGELDDFGWAEVGGGLGPSVAGLLNAPYITYAADAILINERVATAGTNVSFDLTTPGQFIINATGGGGGTNLQTAITNQGAVPTTQAFNTRIQIGDGNSWQFEDQAGNDVVFIGGDAQATAFAVTGGNTAGGAGQTVSVTGGAATVAAQNGGTVTFTGGAGNTTGSGGSMLVLGGPGGANGNGASALLRGGAGGSVSGNAGSATVAGGIPVDGNGGAVSVVASSGVGVNRSGGPLILASGNSTGNAAAGNLSISAGDGGATGTPGSLAITGGGAGTVSGPSGPVTISTLPTTSGASASVTITTGNATGGVAGDIVARGGTGTTNGRFIAQPIWAGDGQAIAIVGNGANSATAGLHAGSRNPNGLVSSNPGSLYMQNAGTSGAAYINTSGADPGSVWSQIATSSAVTLQLAITNQSTTPTTQNFATSIGLTGGGSWVWLNNAALPLVTIEDDASVGVAITGQDTAIGSGQNVRITGGAATALNQTGGGVTLSGGAPNGTGAAGMVHISSAWALDATISPAALAGGNNNNYAPTNGTTSNTWRLTPNAAGSTITGITGGQSGRKLELFNLSTGTVIVLTHDDTGDSTAANCFLLPNATSLTIPPLGSVSLWYDVTSSRWRVDVSGNVTLQAAIDNQGTTPTSQNFNTSIDLTSTAAWAFRNNAGNSLVTIEDDAAIGINISGQDTTAGAGQDVNISGGTATAAGQAGGDVILAAGGISTPGDTFGMVRVNSAWALDSTISPAALAAGTTNDYAPTNGPESNTWRLTPNAAGSTITGITAPQAGRKIEIFNISTTAAITLAHDTGSTATNRFLLPNASSLVIPPLSSVALWYDTTNSRWRVDGGLGPVASAGVTQVQDFTNTAGGTFDAAAAIAAGFTFAHVIVIGAGGGGGGGASTTTPGGALAVGGTGGGGGCRYEQEFRLSELAATVAITVGTGGTGGAGGSNGNGTSGTAGGNSSFGTHLVVGGGGGGMATPINTTASGGAGGGLNAVGGNGASGADSVGGGPGPSDTTANGLGANGGKGGGSRAVAAVNPGSTEWGGAGGAGCQNAITNTQVGGSSYWGGAGGGLGGGHNTAGAGQVATAGGSQRSTTAGGGGAPGTTGSTTSAGSNGTNGGFTTPGSAGGGGGGISNSVSNQPGGRGGDGGTYGNGGGGGGATAGNGAGSPQTGGRGGDGAQGAVRVILY